MPKKYENMGDGAEEREEAANKKKKRFTLNPFETVFRKDGKGVEKGELKVLEKPGFVNYFKLLGRRMNHVFSVNLLTVFGNFPIFFALAAIAYTTREVLGPDSQIYPVLFGSAYFDHSPVITALLGIFGRQDSISMMTTATYVFLGLTLLLFITFGPVNAGVAYIIRNIMRGDPVFVWSDFWYAIKKNFKQALIFGIIDLLMIGMLAFDMLSYRVNAGLSSINMMLYVISYGMSILYFFIRMYPYLMIVTFDMSIFKIIKNSVFFAILGFKRNVMALLATVILVVLDIYLIRLFMPLGLILPFVILFGLLQYTSVYCAFPKIKEIMIDPYYKEVSKAE
ncbi:MAG: DUF624 domain-containing protein [Clostridia bacterium]|nr:DUF624 domain-containing protein [Clostridia bacterium]